MMRIEKSSALLKERYTYLEHASGLPIYVFPKQMTGAYALFAVRYGSLDSEFADRKSTRLNSSHNS